MANISEMQKQLRKFYRKWARRSIKKAIIRNKKQYKQLKQIRALNRVHHLRKEAIEHDRR